MEHIEASGLPPGASAEYRSGRSSGGYLIVHTPADLAPSHYTFDIAATYESTLAQIGKTSATLNVVACDELQSGEFTQVTNDRPVSIFEGRGGGSYDALLVPLQVCAYAQSRTLEVTLLSAVSEAGTPMTTPPRFEAYRSLVWPAPDDWINAMRGYYDAS